MGLMQLAGISSVLLATIPFPGEDMGGQAAVVAVHAPFELDFSGLLT